MQYLLDTNWIAGYLRATQAFVSQSTQPSKAEDQLRRFAHGCQILGIDERIARIWGEEDARLSSTGQKIADVDLFIAATARAHGLILCTQNRKHFERIEGLKIESV